MLSLFLVEPFCVNPAQAAAHAVSDCPKLEARAGPVADGLPSCILASSERVRLGTVSSSVAHSASSAAVRFCVFVMSRAGNVSVRRSPGRDEASCSAQQRAILRACGINLKEKRSKKISSFAHLNESFEGISCDAEVVEIQCKAHQRQRPKSHLNARKSYKSDPFARYMESINEQLCRVGGRKEDSQKAKRATRQLRAPGLTAE
eukprot:6189146-Pleurochrysis_carterae.AAC.3